MADDSGREQIIDYLKEQVQELEDLNHVTRLLPSYADLQQFAETQFPVAAIAAGLPQPVAHRQGREPGGTVDIFQSTLAITVFVFDQINEDSDQRISYLADELWAKLWEAQTKEGAADFGTESITFGEVPTYLRPYIGFTITVSCKYKHTTGGI
jgi:hypothetical protein